VETNRRWQHSEDISIIESEVTEYLPNETARLVADPELQHEGRSVSIRPWAKKAAVSENTVRAARRGDRLRKSTIEKLRKALKELLENNAGTFRERLDDTQGTGFSR
jgi:hypothetical protein